MKTKDSGLFRSLGSILMIHTEELTSAGRKDLFWKISDKRGIEHFFLIHYSISHFSILVIYQKLISHPRIFLLFPLPLKNVSIILFLYIALPPPIRTTYMSFVASSPEASFRFDGQESSSVSLLNSFFLDFSPFHVCLLL